MSGRGLHAALQAQAAAGRRGKGQRRTSASRPTAQSTEAHGAADAAPVQGAPPSIQRDAAAAHASSVVLLQVQIRLLAALSLAPHLIAS